jgi:predicted phosphodiesterase
MWLGVIGNTEGHVAPEASLALRDSDYIVHCGGVGTWEVIEDLSKLARVTGVVGPGDDPNVIPFERVLAKSFSGTMVYVVHKLGEPLDLDPTVKRDIQKVNPRIVLFGGTAAFNRRIDDRLFFCPGAAGKKKGKSARTVGLVEIDGQSVRGEIIELDK